MKGPRKKQSEDGYATVMVTGILSLISVFIMLVLQGSLNQARKSQILVQQVETDLLLESGLNGFLADLAVGRLKVNQDGLMIDRTVSDMMVEIQLSYDIDRLQVNKASEDEVRSQLLERLGAENWVFLFVDEIIGARLGDGRVSSEELEEVLLSLRPYERNCVNSHLTIFETGAAKPRRSADGGRVLPDGSIVRILLVTKEKAPIRWLDVTGIKTGRKDDPFWVLDWKRGSGSPYCHERL